MDILISTGTGVATFAATNAGKFTLAVNQLIPIGLNSSTKIADNWTVYVGMCDGDYSSLGNIVAGNNSAVVEVKPKYFPVATKGAECAALVSTLDWADVNLTDYEYLQLSATSYFVTGVLNSSQTQANDPFNSSDSPGVTSACCWNGGYVEGLNPF